jgi:hypothetical protein
MARRTKKTDKATAAARPSIVPELLPAPVPDDEIDAAYDEIRTLARDVALAVHIEVGAIIVRRFYGGDLGAWRDRGPKDASFRKLAAKFERDDAAPDGTSATGLHRAVSIFVMDQQFGVSDRKHLTLTHVRALIGLAEGHQARLLTEANDRRWSIERVEREVAKIRKKEGRARGRPPLPGFVKDVTRLRKLLESGDALFADLDQADRMEDADVQGALETIASMASRLQGVRERLEARLSRPIP